MKVTNLTKEAFTPIEFSVKLESKRELELWWALSNSSYESLTEFLNANIQQPTMDIATFEHKEAELRSFSDTLFPYIDKTLDPKTK